VEKDETGLPQFFFGINKNNGVIIRLRGTSDGPKALKHSNAEARLVNKSNFSTSGELNGLAFITLSHGNYIIKSTLVLDNNITLKGIGGTAQSSYYQGLIRASYYTTLVLRKGAVITDYYATNATDTYIPIRADFATTGNPKKFSSLRIEGGSITNCTFAAPHLIRFGTATRVDVPGAFYMAPSTAENPINLSGNTNNYLYGGASTKLCDLSEELENGFSFPVAN
jgi:hypothetical protein